MIPDRIIEQGTLTTDGRRSAVEVRLPWYRALPGSCIAGATLTIDGIVAPADSLRWQMNGREFTFDELRTNTEEWWFPTDSAVLSGEVIADADAEHEVTVGLTLYIPYIIIWWISDYSSLIYQEPATLFVEALEDSVLIQIDFKDEQTFLREIPKMEKFERIITQRSLAFQQKRLLSNFTKTAEERYDEFINKYSAIANRVPQYALASYLGFSTEYLSKIRNRKTLKS